MAAPAAIIMPTLSRVAPVHRVTSATKEVPVAAMAAAAVVGRAAIFRRYTDRTTTGQAECRVSAINFNHRVFGEASPRLQDIEAPLPVFIATTYTETAV